jgi:hypothetical protein
LKGIKNQNPMVNYLKEVEDKNIFPRGMGFVHRKDNVKEINLKSFYVRDDYIVAISKGINVA